MSRQKIVLWAPTGRVLATMLQIVEKTKIRSILAANIIRLRKQRGWSQNALAAKANVGLTTIKEIELDKSEGWRITRERLAKALGCTLEDLYKDPNSLETQWASMSQRQMAQVMLSQAEEIDRLKAQVIELEKNQIDLLVRIAKKTIQSSPPSNKVKVKKVSSKP